MQFTSFILLQLDEACRFIKDKRIAQLRIALLLLDNAAEILMDHCISDIMSTDNFRERIRAKALDIPQNKRSPDLQELVEWTPLKYKEKVAINRYFDEKVNFLYKNCKKIDLCYVKPLSHLHKYRNEAYHEAKVRIETIETAAKIYLDINCELLMTLIPWSFSYPSDEDYSWVEKRFSIESMYIEDDFFIKVAKDFREQINLDDKNTCQLLAKHLDSRCNKVQSQVDFIMTHTRWQNRNSMLFSSCKYADEIRDFHGEIKPSKSLPQSNYSMEFLLSIYSQIEMVNKSSNRLDAFRIFANIETEFEPIETDLNTIVREIESALELESEIARGK